MRKNLLLGFSIAICNLSFAQHCDSLNLGTKTLYTVTPAKASAVPAGYYPVFINHVGRHGSRHLTKDVNASAAYQLLLKADSAGQLTKAGISLKRLLQQLNTVEHPHVKSISAQGVQEQHGIAERLFQQHQQLFNNNLAPYAVQITKEIRTKQTADAFLSKLINLSGITGGVTYQVNDTILRFYDLSPAYTSFEENGDWKMSLQNLKQKWFPDSMVEDIINRFFKKPFLTSVKEAGKEEFALDVYGFFTIMPSIMAEVQEAGIQLAPDSIGQFFSCQELAAIGKADRGEDFLVKGPGTNKEGIQVKIAAPLLVDFINTTDKYIQGKDTWLQLRFSHAETIAPFAALLGLSGADKPVKNISLFDDGVWNAATVAPLSANIQWILYKNRNKEDYLVKFLLNEKAVKITGLTTATFPFYNWKAVRKFYIDKLKHLQLRLSDSLYPYLQKLQ